MYKVIDEVTAADLMTGDVFVEPADDMDVVVVLTFEDNGNEIYVTASDPWSDTRHLFLDPEMKIELLMEVDDDA